MSLRHNYYNVKWRDLYFLELHFDKLLEIGTESLPTVPQRVLLSMSQVITKLPSAEVGPVT